MNSIYRSNERGFSLIQTLLVTGVVSIMATGLIAITGFMQDSVSQFTAKASVTSLSSTLIDKLRYDPISLRDSGFDQTLNPDLFDCLSGASFKTTGGLIGDSVGGVIRRIDYKCEAYDFTAKERKFKGFTIKDRVTGLAISGPPGSPAFYDNSGQPCSGSECPVSVVTEFSPVCPRLFGALPATTDFSSDIIATARCGRPDEIIVRSTTIVKKGTEVVSKKVMSERVPAALWNTTRCTGHLVAVGMNQDRTANCGERYFEFLGPGSKEVPEVGYAIGSGAINNTLWVGRPADIYIVSGFQSYVNGSGVTVPSELRRYYLTLTTRGWFEPSQARQAFDEKLSIVRMDENGKYEWSRFPLAEYVQSTFGNSLVVKDALKPNTAAFIPPPTTSIAPPRIAQMTIAFDSSDPALGAMTGYSSGESQSGTPERGQACPTVRPSFGGPRKAVLARYDSDGQLLWAKLPFYDGSALTASDLPAFVESQTGGMLLGAVRLGDQDFNGVPRPGIHQQLALARIDKATGDLGAWAYFGPTGSVGPRREYFHTDHLHVESAPDNTFFLAGTITGGTLPGSSSTGVFFVSRIDSDLNVLWTRQFGPSQIDCQTVGGLSVLADAGGVSNSGVVLTSIAGLQHGLSGLETDLFVLTRNGAPNIVTNTTYAVRRLTQEGAVVGINLNLAKDVADLIPGRLTHLGSNLVTLAQAAGVIYVGGDAVKTDSTGLPAADAGLARSRVLLRLDETSAEPVAFREIDFTESSRLYWLQRGEFLSLTIDPVTEKLLTIATPSSRVGSGSATALAAQTNGFVMLAWPQF